MDKIFKKCSIKNFDFDFKNQPWSSHKDITVSHTINKETYHYQIFINVALVRNISFNIGIDVKTASIILQPPGHTIHLHEDKFFKLKNEYPNAPVDRIVRANIFLEDWVWGQFMQFDDLAVTKWKKNEGYIFNCTVPHLSTNASFENKYTLQITGLYK